MTDQPMKLRCGACKELLPVTDFHRSKTTKRGYQGRCKACVLAAHTPETRKKAVEVSKTWYWNNHEQAKAHRRNYYTGPDKKDRKVRLRDQHLQRTFGLTLDEYFRKLNDQGGCCDICRKPQSEQKRQFAVDHCHTHGYVRSILCDACNPGLGHFKDNPELLRRAADYLEEHYERYQNGRSGDAGRTSDPEGSSWEAWTTEEVGITSCPRQDEE